MSQDGSSKDRTGYVPPRDRANTVASELDHELAHLKPWTGEGFDSPTRWVWDREEIASALLRERPNRLDLQPWEGQAFDNSTEIRGVELRPYTRSIVRVGRGTFVCDVCLAYLTRYWFREESGFPPRHAECEHCGAGFE